MGGTTVIKTEKLVGKPIGAVLVCSPSDALRFDILGQVHILYIRIPDVNS